MGRIVVNLLPHRGGGAESFIDCLEPLEEYEQRRVALSAGRRPLDALRSLPLGWPRAARAVRRGDIVQTHGDVASILALPLLRRRPSVAVMQGLHLLRRSAGARRRLAVAGLRRVAKAADQIVCSSEDERAQLAAILPAGLHGRLAVVANTVPPRPGPAPIRTAARARFALDDDELVALFLGRLEPRKDPLVAARATAAARAEGAPLVLLVAGEGPLAEETEAAGAEAVRMLGYRDDVDALLAAADIFVLPSHREGQSFALLEAMDAGLALVVADGAGNAETVGDAGLVFPVGDDADLARVLKRLASDRDELARLQRAARERAAAHFNPDAFRARMAGIYSALLG